MLSFTIPVFLKPGLDEEKSREKNSKYITICLKYIGNMQCIIINF